MDLNLCCWTQATICSACQSGRKDDGDDDDEDDDEDDDDSLPAYFHHDQIQQW